MDGHSMEWLGLALGARPLWIVWMVLLFVGVVESSDDAALVTCLYLMRGATGWVEKSLLLAAIGESRDRGVAALEAFAYRYPERETQEERFLVHRTVFPRDFLDEFGFVTLRSHGRVQLCRLELGGLQPVEEGRRAKVLRVVQDAFTPTPVPVPRP